jgi:RNA polymerase sigma factor (TIGR02999 family)
VVPPTQKLVESMSTEGMVTQLISAHREGDNLAGDRLFALVYDELHAMARRQLKFRSPGETLNTTGLVHEAYLKLFDRDENGWNDRVHFFSVTARAMRQILVDYARKINAEKRGGGAHHTEIDASIISDSRGNIDILDLDTALKQLEELNPRLATIVECRFFGGMSIDETAALLDVSSRTIDREWLKAKSFLYIALQQE